MKITINRMKVRPSSLRPHTVTSFNENDIWQSYKTRKYEKEINLIDVSFIFCRKLASRECVIWGPKMLKIDFGVGWRVVPCPMAIRPMIFRLLGRWPTGQKFQNDHCIIHLPCMPILDPFNSTANKNMMSKIWTNGEQLSDWVENIVGKIALYE